MDRNKNRRLLSMSRVAPKRDTEEMDTVAMPSRRWGERNKRYTNGFQWDDKICVDGKTMTEEGYIKSQDTVPLKNNRTVPPSSL